MRRASASSTRQPSRTSAASVRPSASSYMLQDQPWRHAVSLKLIYICASSPWRGPARFQGLRDGGGGGAWPLLQLRVTPHCWVSGFEEALGSCVWRSRMR